MSASFHTIVIGAGPAGLACATAIAASGRTVLLLERLARIGPKPCAGGIPAAALDPALPPELIERQFHEQFIATRRQRFTLSAPQPIICTVDREKLGEWMRQQAVAAGVTIKTGIRAEKIEESRVITDQGDFAGEFLVGADGSNSLVRRRLGIKVKLAGIGINYQVPGDFPRMEWHLDRARFGAAGYAWIFPHRESASIGVYGFRHTLRSQSLHDQLRQWARERGIVLDAVASRASLISFDYQGHCFGKTFLAGDAAGLASGLTGEGIAAALLSGRAVADTIISGRDQGRLADLLRRHARHRQLTLLAHRFPRLGEALIEALALALRGNLLSHHALELT